MIHLLMECYRNWGENSETEMSEKEWNETWKLVVLIARVTIQNGSCCTSVPHPYLHGEALIPIWNSWSHQPCKENAVVIHFLMKNESAESENEWRCLNRKFTWQSINLVVLKARVTDPVFLLHIWTLSILASFPGLLRLQFLIICSMQKWSILQAIKNWSRRRPGNEANQYLHGEAMIHIENSSPAHFWFYIYSIIVAVCGRALQKAGRRKWS